MVQNYGEIIKYGFLSALGAGILYLGYQAYQQVKANPSENPFNPQNYTTGAYANPISQAGASLSLLADLPSNYQGATVLYATNTAQQSANNAQLINAFETNQQQAVVTVSPLGEVSTYGGGVNQSLTRQQANATASNSPAGSLGNPFIIGNGWRGQGYYATSAGNPPIYFTSQSFYAQEVASIKAGVSVPLSGGGGLNWL